MSWLSTARHPGRAEAIVASASFCDSVSTKPHRDTMPFSAKTKGCPGRHPGLLGYPRLHFRDEIRVRPPCVHRRLGRDTLQQISAAEGAHEMLFNHHGQQPDVRVVEQGNGG